MKTQIFYVRIPHQTDPSVVKFDEENDLIRFLEHDAPDGASRTAYSRQEWEQHGIESGEEPGSAWWNKWIKPGLDLFDQGAEQIVEVWRSECCRRIHDADAAPSWLEVLMDVTDDFHAHFILSREQAEAAIANPERLPQHRRFAVVERLADALAE